MKCRPLLRRRTLLAAVSAGGALGFGTAAGALGSRARPAEYAALAALCSRLDCPRSVGDVCRSALPPGDRAAPSLARSLIAALRAANGGRYPANALAPALRQLSQDDFQAGRVVDVDGWMLSVTETRLYALAAQLSPAAARPDDDGPA